MTPDPRWLDVLKTVIATGGWYKLAIAGTFGLYLLLNYWQLIPSPEAWEIRASAFGLLLFGLLATANFIVAAHKFFPIERWASHWIVVRRAKRGLRGYIPHMTKEERTIIAYLLEKNQKTFTAAADGGHAATLLSLEAL